MNQAQSEQEMRDLGVQRYRSNLAKARQRQAETRTAGGRRLLQESVVHLEAGIKAWMKTAREADPHNLPIPYKYLEDVGVPKAALIGAKAILDSIALDMPLTTTALMLASRLEDECRLQRMWMTHRDAFRQSSRFYSGEGQKYRMKRQKRDEAVHWREDPWLGWPKRDRLRLGVTICEIMRTETGLIEIENRVIAGPRFKTKAYVSATSSCLKWLEDAHEYHEVLHPVYLPCVVPPVAWKQPWGGGYVTDVLLRRPFIKTQDRKYLEDLEAADMTEVYSAVNAVQGTPWEINLEVYEVMKHFWDLGTPVAGLPVREDDPTPPKPDEDEATELDLLNWKRSVAQTKRRNESHRSARMSLARVLAVADRYAVEGQRMWYPHKADFRGRLYPIPGFLQPQGQDTSRGLLRFADGLSLMPGETWAWFQVHGANCFGVDKVSFDLRREWVGAHQFQIMCVYEDPITNTWWTEADSPWQFLAWCLEYGAFQTDPTGFVSHIPIAMDGSNNGLQIFSMLLRDPQGAQSTNVTPSDTPQDIYQDVADAVTDRLRLDAKEDHPYARYWLAHCPEGVPRAATKRAVMVLPYGGTAFSCTTFVRDWLLDEIGEITNAVWPSEFGWKPTKYLSKLIRESILATVSSAQGCMEWLQEIASIASLHDVHLEWKSPSGFLVRQNYLMAVSRRIRTRVGDVVRTNTLLEDGDRIDSRRSGNSVSPNFVHALDSAVLTKTVNACAAEGITSFSMVHDSFATHAAHAPAMARILREQYAAMFKQDLLADFRNQILAKLPKGVQLPPVPETGDLDVNQVINSLYFFA